MPKEASIDDKTKDVYNQKEADIHHKSIDVWYGFLIMPKSQVDISKKFSIWSKVCHQDQGHISQRHEGLPFTQNQLHCSFWKNQAQIRLHPYCHHLWLVQLHTFWFITVLVFIVIDNLQSFIQVCCIISSNDAIGGCWSWNTSDNYGQEHRVLCCHVVQARKLDGMLSNGTLSCWFVANCQ